MANKKYKLTDGNYWATDGIHDFGQNKTQREINAALVQADSDLSGAIKYILTSTGDSTDRYSDIMYCLNNYGACVLGNGVFYINSTISMPNGSSLSGIGVGSILQLKDNSAGNVAVNVGSYCSVENLTIKGNSTELSYSSYTKGSRGGILLNGDAEDFEHMGTFTHNYAKLHNLTITDFNGFGIRGYKNNGSASFLATNIDILRCHTGIDIAFFSEFHSFTNIRCRYCNIGVVNQGGNNQFVNCHFSTNISNMECDDSQTTLVNAAHSSFVGCSFAHPNNNTGYNVYVRGTANGWIFSNCQFWYGIIRFDDSTGVILSNNVIGGTNNTIIIARCTQVIITDNIFKSQIPTINLVGTQPVWMNNLNPDGSLNYQYDYSSIGNLTSIYKPIGTLNNYTIEALGHCYATDTWEVTLPLCFSCNGAATATVTRIILIGKGTVSSLSNITVNALDTYVRVRNIPYTGTVGDCAFINVMMNYSITPT